MNKIHVLPTDKPSRLSILNSGKLNFGAEIMSSSNSKPQHIYITSDEITGFENNIWVHNNGRVWLWQNTMALRSDNKPRKIILTTDQDLIKDGVQKIDDEFLEWFVKNPSYELVEVEREKSIGYAGDRQRTFYGGYKIIFPKEEPKQETHLDIKDNKIELLEEDLECIRMYLDDLKIPENDKDGNKYSIIGRIKWQAERMYSEEDVLDAWELGAKEGLPLTREKKEELFEQFKKK